MQVAISHAEFTTCPLRIRWIGCLVCPVLCRDAGRGEGRSCTPNAQLVAFGVLVQGLGGPLCTWL